MITATADEAAGISPALRNGLLHRTSELTTTRLNRNAGI